MAEDKNSRSPKVDTGNLKEGVNLGRQLGQSMGEAADRANDLRFAMETSIAAANNLQQAAQNVAFDPKLAATFKIFEEDSKAVIGNIKKYPALIDKATKSNKGLGEIQKVIAKAQQDASGIATAQQKAFESAAEANNKAAELQAELQSQVNAEKAIQREIDKARDLGNRDNLEALYAELEANTENITALEGKVSATQEVAKAAQEYGESLETALDTANQFIDTLNSAKNETKDLNSATKLFGTAANIANSEFLKSLPVFSQLASHFEKAEEAARELHIETEGAATAAHTMGAAFNVIATAGLAGLFAGFVNALGEASDRAGTIAIQLNVTKDEANAVSESYREFADASGQAYTTVQDFIAAQTELNKLLGTSATITADQGAAFSNMTERMGLAAESAASLLRYSSALGMNASDLTEEIVGQVHQFNIQNDQVLSYSDIMEDIASTSAATRLTLSKFPGGITRAAIQARNLGLTLEDITGASDSFLDFQSSISAELEAELLTGKQLNLEQARLAALKGDTAKVAEEIAKQNITAAEFTNLNVVQQQALAKAVGLSVDKLGEALETQEAQKAAAEATAKALGVTDPAELQKEVDKIIAITDEKEKQKALDKLNAEASDYLYKQELKSVENIKDRATREEALQKLQKQYAKSQKAIDDANLSNREKLKAIQDKVLDAFASLAVKLEPVIDSVLTLVGNLSSGALSKGILGVTGLFAGFKAIKGVKNLFQGKTGELGSSKNNPLYVQSVNGGVGGGLVDSLTGRGKGKGKFLKGLAKRGGKLGGLASKAGSLATKLPLGKLAGVLGKVAAPLAAAKGLYDGYKGFTADPNAQLKDKLLNAGESILNGLSFGFIGRSAAEIAAEAQNAGALKAGEQIVNTQKRSLEKAGFDTSTSSPGATNPTTDILAAELGKLGAKLDSIDKGISSGGDVYIDGNKAGKSLVLASSKLS